MELSHHGCHRYRAATTQHSNTNCCPRLLDPTWNSNFVDVLLFISAFQPFLGPHLHHLMKLHFTAFQSCLGQHVLHEQLAKNSPQIDGVSTQQPPVECDGLHQFNLNLLWGVELDVGSSHWWLISPSQGPKMAGITCETRRAPSWQSILTLLGMTVHC